MSCENYYGDLEDGEGDGDERNFIPDMMNLAPMNYCSPKDLFDHTSMYNHTV